MGAGTIKECIEEAYVEVLSGLAKYNKDNKIEKIYGHITLLISFPTEFHDEVIIEWDDFGTRVVEKILFIDNDWDELFKSYYSSGRIRCEGRLFNNNRYGKWIRYDSAGKVIKEEDCGEKPNG